MHKLSLLELCRMTGRPGARPKGQLPPWVWRGSRHSLEKRLALLNSALDLPTLHKGSQQSRRLLIGDAEVLGDLSGGVSVGQPAHNLALQSVIGDLRLGRLALSGVLLLDLRTQSGQLLLHSVIGNSVDSNIESGNISHLRHGIYHLSCVSLSAISLMI